MAVEALKVTASYDGANLDKGLNKLQKELAATSVAAGKLDSSLSRGTKGSNEAAFALQNLGRVAQDAPFGFIGIANNINPLVESFQRLKKESGSTGGALKALAGSLAGGGGLGLAFSVVTAAISFASIGLQAWKGRNGEAKAAVDENKKATEEYAKSLDQVAAKGQASAITLQNFVNIAKDQTQSLGTRNEALEQANKILGDHGDKLTLVNIATAAVTAQIEKFTQATIQQALATKFADRAADLFINQKNAAKTYGVELAKLRELEKKTLSFENAQGVQVLTDAGKEVEKQRRVVAELATGYKTVTGELRGVVGELSAAQLAASQLFGSLDGPDKISGIIGKLKAEIKSLNDVQPTLLSEQAITENVARIKVLEAELDRLLGKKRDVKVVKDVKDVQDVLAELGRELDFLNAKGIAFNTNEGNAKIAAYFGTIEKLIKDFKVAPDDQLITKLFGKANSIKAAMATQELQKVTSNASEVLSKIPIIAPVRPVIEVGAIDKFLVEATESVTAAMESLFENIATSIGDTLGRALAGSASIGDFFNGIFSQLGASMQELGKFFIQTGIQIKLIKSFLIKNPALAIAGGIALVALGGLIKAKTNTPAFATGGVAPGGGILVGERGPEILTPPRGSVITPNAQTNAMLAGGGSIQYLYSVIRGEDIVMASNRAAAKMNRNGQR